MERYSRGMTAVFLATVVLSIIMIAKSLGGLLPALSVPGMLSAILLMPGVPVVGWIAHFLIGTILWGLLFAAFGNELTGPWWLRGAKFATGAWLLMMVFIMPVAGAGFFAMNLGFDVLVATLVLHWIYGVTLGLVYAAELRGAQAGQAGYASRA